MTREWLMKDNITPAETVVQMMFASMPESLRRIFLFKTMIAPSRFTVR